MLTIICGEDTSASRTFLIDLKRQYKSKEYLIEEITPSQIVDIAKDEGSMSLFGQSKAYFTSNMSSLFSRKGNGSMDVLKELAQNKEIQLIDWEGNKGARDLVKYKTIAQIKEFKPSKTIFNLLDACYPTNLKPFVNLLNSINQEEGFMFAMLAKHIRTLILVKIGNPPSALASWQVGKLFDQTQRWDQEKLVNFYVGLARIDQSLKTSNNTFGIKKSLELLACYYL